MKTGTSEWKRGLVSGIPIALGYFAVSFTFGIVAVSSGLNWQEAVLISALNLTSAGQFAGLNIMIAAGTYFEMALSQLVINLRYALMSVALSQKADQSIRGIYRWLFAFFHTDEIFAVAAGEERLTRRFFSGLMVLPFFGWTLGTLAGALGGSILPDMICDALGLALYGMFIAIFIPAAKGSRKVMAVVALAICFSCCFYYIPGLNRISSGFAIIISAVAAAALAAAVLPSEEV